MNYPLANSYARELVLQKIMGPNPLKLAEELLGDHKLHAGDLVMDLGCGQGLTSVFLAKEYGFRVLAADLWSNPTDNKRFFAEQGFTDEQIWPLKVDATAFPFAEDTFDGVVSLDAYNYFGRDEAYLGEHLLPLVKKQGYIYIAVPGMKRDCHDNLPQELLLSWTPEQLAYLRDADYWKRIVSATSGVEVISVSPMQGNSELWDDWLACEHPYAVSDRLSMQAGAGAYLNFVGIVLRRK